MMRAAAAAALLCLLPLLNRAQTAANVNPEADAKEKAELVQAINEAGGSSIDLIRALENHLSRYPDSKERSVIEKGLAKAAMEANDNARIVQYGEKVLAREAPPDSTDGMAMLDRVIRALVDDHAAKAGPGDSEPAKKALAYCKRYKDDIAALRVKNEPPGHLTAGQWSDELDKAQARALALEARATGNTSDPGSAEAAQQLAKSSWAAYPTGEGAREAAYWLTKLGRKADAIEYYADAFTLEDPRTTETDRARDRARLGELYTSLHGSEKGLGDEILQAYDRTSALLNERREILKAKDPNAVATNVVDFTLPAVDKTAPPLVLSSLKGKTIVMDFWATWCVPCRAQHPLIEQVSEHFRSDPDVLFVPVDSDDDTSLVAPFIKQQGWKSQGYLEDGLARRLTISSIPSVLIIGPDQRIASRIVGVRPDRFEQMLTERIELARRTGPAR